MKPRGWRLRASPTTWIALGLVVVVASAVLYWFLRLPPVKPLDQLVVYAPRDFMSLGPASGAGVQTAFHLFELEHNVTISIESFDNVSDMIRKVASGRRPMPDVFVGIDNLRVFEAKDAELLEPYRSTALGDVPDWIEESLDPEHYLVPISYTPIAVLLDDRVISESTHPGVSNLSISMLSSERFAVNLVLSDPELTELGSHVLVWQVLLYEKVLGQDWREWWARGKAHLLVSKTAGEAYDSFLSGSEERHIMVGTASDPVYSLWVNRTFDWISARLISERGKLYTWVEIDGAGVARGTPRREMAQKLIDSLLSYEVQRYMPEGDWSYPVNVNVELPPSFDDMIGPDSFIPLNTLAIYEEIESNLSNWLSEWKSIMKDT